MNARDRVAILAALGLAVAGGATVRGAATSPAIAIPPPAEILAKLRPGHPRLLLSAEGIRDLKARVQADPRLGAWQARLRAQAQAVLDQAPSRYEIPDGLRLLATSRRVLARVQTLALLYRLEGERRYLDRAWQELAAAASFPDWNPRHFLDTAEMTHAFAIGYDWLYEAWTDEQRATLRDAIVAKGLQLGVESHRGAASYGGWTKSRHNWNQVCNGGVGMGALAVADAAPELAGEFLHAALQSIQLPMAEYAPDGAWAEGPGYWNYATSYNVVFLAALQSALGTDFALGSLPGFAQAGMFPIYVTGPLGRTFNYADGSDAPIRAPAMLWLAARFATPAYAAYQLKFTAVHPLDLVWFTPERAGAEAATLPLDKHFRRAEIVTLRSAWDDPNAVFIGFKGGDNQANHSHLDLGTFVLDALGVRWALDLGADDYNLPGYFGGHRWTYYRLRAEGHNTLLINPGQPPDQNPRAAARILKFQSSPERAFAIADLTPAYAPDADKVHRGLALLDRRRVLVQDEVQAPQPAEVWWFLHTRAEVKVAGDGTTATLTQEGQQLVARLLAPAGARFEVRAARPLPSSPHPEGQNENSDVRKLAVRLDAVREVRLAVLLEPQWDAHPTAAATLALQPLSQW